ncbi:MAG: NAD(P)H-hydrate dehydratase [Candidatus Omnitrophota bacterium]
MKISKEFRSIVKRRESGAHKGDFGHVFVLAGSPGFTGAAYLAGEAAITSGSGLVTVGVPKSLHVILASKFVEVMTKPLPETKKGTLSFRALGEIQDFSKKTDVLAVGPGLSCEMETQRLVHKLITTVDKPIVLDADGLNAVSKDLELLKKRKRDMVITPHPGEMARLIKRDVDFIQKNRIKIAKDFARNFKLTVVLKGHRTVVADSKGNCYINETGNPGMATAGSGDVLTGVIAGLVGQGIGIFDATTLAVYVHGASGDLAKEEKGEISLIATDILKYLPFAFKLLYN